MLRQFPPQMRYLSRYRQNPSKSESLIQTREGERQRERTRGNEQDKERDTSEIHRIAWLTFLGTNWNRTIFCDLIRMCIARYRGSQFLDLVHFGDVRFQWNQLCFDVQQNGKKKSDFLESCATNSNENWCPIWICTEERAISFLSSIWGEYFQWKLQHQNEPLWRTMKNDIALWGGFSW